MKDLMLYIHFPFCIKKCDYCDFCSFPYRESAAEEYLKTLNEEIIAFSDNDLPKVSSVFFGGGTPSLIGMKEFDALMYTIREHYSFTDDCEISIEANPGTIEKEKVDLYLQNGVNRLSMGLQSINDKSLELLGRIHDSYTFRKNYDLVRDRGFENVNVDIISAIPGETADDYTNTLKTLMNIEPDHISAYSLIIEEGTPFYEKYGGVSPVDEDTDRRLYEVTEELLGFAGYKRYEISNYALKGRECRHNLGYWSMRPYRGFGLSACSYIRTGDDHVMITNTRDLAEYIKDPCFEQEIEVHDMEDRMEEFMFLGLRKCAGISTADFKEMFSEDIDTVFGEVINRNIRRELLRQEGDMIFLTKKGIDISNMVLSEFLLH